MLGARWFARATIAAILLTLIPAAPAPAAHNVSRLEQTRREIRATRARLATVLRTDAEILSALNAVSSQLRVQQAHLAAARAHLARIDLAIRAEQRRLDALDARREARTEAIRLRARALYMMGAANTLQALTDAGTIEEFVGRAGAIELVTAADRRTVESLQSAEFDARRTRRALRARRAAAAEVRDEVAERVSIVAEAVAAKREVHHRLSGRIDSYRSEIAALQREQNRIIALIRARTSTSTGPISRSGFTWPIRGAITSPYGPRWGGFHTGMDIDCRTGDAIGASKAGRVIEAGWGGGYGNMVIIDHGNGVSTLYAHQSRLYVGRGTYVNQRQSVGACGSTGNSTGDHLHFEVRINGNHTNPRPYLP